MGIQIKYQWGTPTSNGITEIEFEQDYIPRVGEWMDIRFEIPDEDGGGIVLKYAPVRKVTYNISDSHSGVAVDLEN